MTQTALKSIRQASFAALFAFFAFWTAFSQISSPEARAGTSGSISGSVVDDQGVSIPDAKIEVRTPSGTVLQHSKSDDTGNFNVFPIEFGDYRVEISAPGFATYRSVAHVNSGAITQIEAQLKPISGTASQGKESELVVTVQAKRHLVQNSSASSAREVTQDEIKELPQGEDIRLPTLIATTTPGVVQGPFGQIFIRGNHANIQYQIDGVQLPDSPSNTFGDAFTPRNIDHMEVITGGIPAEYGERLGSVVNIITKTGPESPSGEAQLNYGSYNTFEPHATYGGSNAAGNLHYFLSAQYQRTDRGLDTPQPQTEGNPYQGGTDAIHDYSNGNNEFAKFDWIVDNADKLSLIVFNSYNYFQIPNYPSTFSAGDPFFQAGYMDPFGNGGGAQPTFNYTPATTDDNQAELNSYVQLVWKRTVSERSFIQIAPYYKYSSINVANDPLNDLASATAGSPFFIPNSTPSSFAENRHVNNFGLKADYSNRFNDRNLFKAGLQLQESQASGSITAISETAGATSTTAPTVAAFTDTNPTSFYFESLYAQDDFTIAKPLILNAGIRFDADQTNFTTAASTDYLFQPRVGLNYLIGENTKLHAFYGKLFQPAPAENLRDTFINTAAANPACGNGGAGCPFDIKAEKDDYFEVGIAQQIAQQAVAVNAYYKTGTNILDDAQLLNTSIAQPYNFANGYAYGIEFSVKGAISEDWSDYFNYSYEIAKGQGISGGFFALPPDVDNGPNAPYFYLDHVQLHTANSGITYAKSHFWGTVQGLFGSGLRTGPNNTVGLPSHFSFDATAGYEFHGDAWYEQFKLSGDVLNIFDNDYPITIANGFNGSHYAAGREFFIRLTKNL